MLSDVLPVLVSVVDAVVLVPRGTCPKLKLAGLSCTTVPTPLTRTFWGLPGALSVIDKAAVRVPPCVGLNVTLIVHLAPDATRLLQVFVWMKSPGSEPVILMLLMLRAIVP